MKNREWEASAKYRWTRGVLVLVQGCEEPPMTQSLSL